MLISKNQLKVIAFASIDKTREALNGINLRPIENIVEATDNKYLVRIKDKSGIQLDDYPNVKPFNDVDGNKLVSTSTVNKLLKLMPSKKNDMPILNYYRAGLNGDKIDFTYTDLDDTQTLTARITEGRYPNTDQIMPKVEDHKVKIAFNAQKMAEICKYIASISGNSHKRVVLHIKDGNNRLLLTAETENESVEAVLMPLKL